VLLLTDHLNLGGVQSFLINLLSAWRDERFTLSVAALHGPGKHHDTFETLGYPPRYVANSKRDWSLPWRLRRLLRESQPDVIHAMGVPSCFLAERARGAAGAARLISHLQSSYRRHDNARYQIGRAHV